MMTLGPVWREIVSAVIASIVILIVVTMWKKAIVPWFEERLYRDLNRAGTWDVSGTEGGKRFAEVAKVKQRGHRVWGVLTYRGQSISGEPQIIEYLFEGEFRNLILTARQWEKRRHSLERGSFTLMVKRNADFMRGYYAWYLDIQSDVVGGEYEWVRRTTTDAPAAVTMRLDTEATTARS